MTPLSFVWQRQETSGVGVEYGLGLSSPWGAVEPCALLSFPHPVAAGTTPPPALPLVWAPVSFAGHLALSLHSPGSNPATDGVVILATTREAWDTLAGQALPMLDDGPVRLAFPPIPSPLPWATA